MYPSRRDTPWFGRLRNAKQACGLIRSQNVCTVYKQSRSYRYNVNSNLYIVPMRAIQLRMARAAVGWGVRELAEKAGVTANTVTRIENGADAKQSTLDRLKSALEAAGVEFIDENGGGPGVRMRNQQQQKG
jgi:ribosome-binding protein aMBF1 (putative translation factor)